jgi:hypothetical protein
MSGRKIALVLTGILALPLNAEAAYNRHVTIINNTSYAMVRFFGSNTGTDAWEEDILGVDVLYPGQSVVVNFNDGTGFCRFDFKAVFEGGMAVVDNGLDVCTITYHRYVN